MSQIYYLLALCLVLTSPFGLLEHILRVIKYMHLKFLVCFIISYAVFRLHVEKISIKLKADGFKTIKSLLSQCKVYTGAKKQGPWPNSRSTHSKVKPRGKTWIVYSKLLREITWTVGGLGIDRRVWLRTCCRKRLCVNSPQHSRYCSSQEFGLGFCFDTQLLADKLPLFSSLPLGTLLNFRSSQNFPLSAGTEVSGRRKQERIF